MSKRNGKYTANAAVEFNFILSYSDNNGFKFCITNCALYEMFPTNDVGESNPHPLTIPDF